MAFRNSPYRSKYSTWFDVAGVVLLLGLMLAPIIYLLAEGDEWLAHRTAPENGEALASRSSQPPPTAARRFSAAPPARGLSVFGDARPAAPPSSGPEAPFSAAWRDRATPDLSVGGSGSSPPLAARSPSAPEGRSAPSTPNLGGPNVSTSSTPTRNGGRDWTAAARRLQGRATALSRQLGQMSRNPSSPASSSGQSGSPTSSDGPAPTSASSDPPLPENDPTVPIDDHLHWLVVAGLLWGSWRLMRG